MDYQEFISFMLKEQVGIFPRIKSEIRRGIILDRLDDIDPSLEILMQEFKPHGDIAYQNSGCNIIASTTSRTGKYIGIGAHYDIKAVTPGANDNTSGIAVLLDLVGRFYSKGPENIGVKFMFFDVEEDSENQCQGSSHYVKSSDLNDMIGLYNLDMVGVGENIVLWGYNGQIPILRPAFIYNSEDIGVNTVEHENDFLLSKIAGVKELRGRSDHSPFRDHIEAMTITALPDSDLRHYKKQGYLDDLGELMRHNHWRGDSQDKLSVSMMRNIASIVYRSVLDLDKKYQRKDYS